MASCTVVTIAMATGAEAERIGTDVAEILGFRYVNNLIITRAAEKEHVTPETIDQVEHSVPLVQRILDSIGTLSAPAMVAESAAMLTAARWDWTDTAAATGDQAAKYRTVILEAVNEIARQGNVVIVAHGAGILLGGISGVLRTFVTGPPEVRSRRLAAAEGIDDRRALRRIAHSDGERKAFLERFFGLRHELPTHYDLVVNTDHLTPQAAATTIVAAARAMT